MKALKVLANWCPRALKNVLYDDNIVVDLVDIRSSVAKLLAYDNEHELYYFARFAPPLIDPSVIRVRKFKKPVIYAFHSPLTVDHPYRPSHYLYNVITPLQAMKLSSVFVIHLLNMTDLNLARTLGVRRAIYLPLGTDTDLFKPQEKDENIFTVIYASTASWHKGTDILVNTIIPQLVRKIEEIKIRIISYGFLQHLYIPLSKWENVEVLSYMPSEEFAKTLSKSHVLLFPSRYESYGLVVLEALASGVIPVAFNVRGFVRDILLKSVFKSFVLKYPDVNGFIDAVMRLYKLWKERPNEYEHLREEARKLAITYSWNNIGKLWAQTFRSIAEMLQ